MLYLRGTAPCAPIALLLGLALPVCAQDAPLTGAEFNQRMGAVDRAERQGQHADALALAQALKAQLLAQERCDPQQIGWAHYYEFRAQYGLKAWQPALDLVEAKLPKPYLISAKNMAFMCSVASECAARLAKPKECLARMSRCIDFRLACKDWAAASTAIASGYQLLEGSQAAELAPRLVVHLLEQALAEKLVEAATLGVAEANRRQGQAEASAITQVLVARFDPLAGLGLERGPAGRPLCKGLALVRQAAWYRRGLSQAQATALKQGEALWAAASAGRADEVKALTSKGAPPEHRALGDDASTPLMAAAKGGHTDALRLLLKRSELNASDLAGRTPLHLACAGGHADAIRALLAAGAKLESKDEGGHTAADLVRGKPDLERLFR